MRQQTFADEAFECYRKPTRREIFLGEMEKIIPWKEPCNIIEPFYPKPKGAGRQSVGLERTLRIHFRNTGSICLILRWKKRCTIRVPCAIFVGIDLGREPVPDETTILKFCHLLEAHNLGEQLFVLIGQYLEENGLKVSTGIIVDASIINAPSSTKNRENMLAPETRQTRKGNQWCFGMKAHIGVDSRTRLIHNMSLDGQ